MKDPLSRRTFFKQMAAAGVLTSAALPGFSSVLSSDAVQANGQTASASAEVRDRLRRMKWWHEARYGMFIHFGLYSLLGQHEWAMEAEGVPIPQYELLAKHFAPKPGCAEEWVKLAQRAGQKYMVLTTKHHEGFCLFDTKLTDYCAPKQAARRDLVREFVDAARAAGMRVGFYYSLMDWHHPDGASCAHDEEARKRFVEYTHGLIRELMTNYGKIDVLWYDVNWPLTAEQWESERMNRMVYELQPDIIINDRNGLPGDFTTPEQHIGSFSDGRAWETCMTMNDSWGYNKSDDMWKNSKTIVSNLIQCAQGGGNYLLNIGPRADGSVPQESVSVLESVGRWLSRNRESIYGVDPVSVHWHTAGSYTARGNTVYMHIRFWPGDTPAQEWLSFFRPPSVMAIGGFRTKVKSAKLLASGKAVTFEQDGISLRLTGLPIASPDDPISVIAIECEDKPVIDTDYVRVERKRFKVGVSE